MQNDGNLDATDSVRVAMAPPSRRREALELLFGAQAADIEASWAASSPSVLFCAFEGETLADAVCLQFQPGRTASVSVPKASDLSSNAPVLLLTQALAEAWRRDTVLVQALVETDGGRDALFLRHAGFRYAADLLYLVSPREAFAERAPASTLTYRAYDEGERPALAQLIEQTYEGTRDCPALNGVRAAIDVLAGYQSVGVFDPRRWLTAKFDGRDVGCLLLADHPASDQWELVYFGLIPQARGRGLGLEMTRHAQWLAGQAGRNQLVLAVDAQNEPALRLYAEAGFQSWDRRSVFLALRP